MSGTRVTAEDLATGETEQIVIEDNWTVVTDGRSYVDSWQQYSNGTVIIVVKRKEKSDE